jgi:maltooligosyltrehalose synthase
VGAYAREHGGEAALVAVPRLAYSLMRGRIAPPLGDAWGKAELELPLSAGDFLNVLTGERLAAGGGQRLLCREIFARFPAALLAVQ